ncbi:hypothetical protein LY78DRAFT_653057 [Colletotrichum sublineola]|nr:hypothetical protein LY78DRAFT_653057 [Colletotrichum sublineola]
MKSNIPSGPLIWGGAHAARLCLYQSRQGCQGPLYAARRRVWGPFQPATAAEQGHPELPEWEFDTSRLRTLSIRRELEMQDGFAFRCVY